MSGFRVFGLLAVVAIFLAIILSVPLVHSSHPAPEPVNLLTATAGNLSTLLESGRITSAKLVDDYLHRIYSHDKNGLRLNSVLNLAPRDQLRYISNGIDDRRRRRGHDSALYGVPVLINDNFAMESSLGLPTTGGAFALADATTKYDSSTVLQLRQAGAIIIGKTNINEFSGLRSHNLESGWSQLGGKTLSPYTFDSPCGSSGGSAVAVAAGFAPVALGTEMSGSVTCPASQNALFSFVPSRNLASNCGMLPITTCFERPGILSKSTADLASVLGIIADADEPSAQDIAGMNYKIDGSAVWTDFRIGLADPDFFSKPHGVYQDETSEIKMYEAISEAMVQMETLGATVSMNASFMSAELIPKAWDAMQPIIYHDMKESFNNFLHEACNVRFKNLAELVEYNRQNWADALQTDGLEYPQGQELLEMSLEEDIDDEEYHGTLRMIYTWATTFGIDHAFRTHEVDFLVVPGWSWMNVYSAIAGAPMGTVPLGMYPDGRPFGMTIVARRGQDAKLLQLMQLYEKSFPPRQPPKSMASLMGNMRFRIRRHFQASP